MKALEHKESVALIQWRNVSLGKYPELKSLIHIPNGGLRNIRVAQKLKAEGTRAGVSDYLLPVARPTFNGHYGQMSHGLWIELKAGKNKPTDIQYEWLYMMRDQGYMAEWAVGWFEASELIVAYLECRPFTNRPLKNRAKLIL
jgi:hypothetical protein